ncbi:hypothetical protein ES702_07292 [subsurface metagenome]
MTRKEEEFEEGKKACEVDKINKLPMRNLNPYTEPYRSGYMSVYTEKTDKDMDKKIEKKDKDKEKA